MKFLTRNGRHWQGYTAIFMNENWAKQLSSNNNANCNGNETTMLNKVRNNARRYHKNIGNVVCNGTHTDKTYLCLNYPPIPYTDYI